MRLRYQEEEDGSGGFVPDYRRETMTDKATPRPWFVSGVRFRMNNQNWISINRYNEATKKDENVAIVGYNPLNGDGQADAKFIVAAVNSYDPAREEKIRKLVEAAKIAESELMAEGESHKRFENENEAIWYMEIANDLRLALQDMEKPE